MGKGRTYLIMEIVKKLFGIVMIVAVMYQGVMAIAVTAMFVTFFAALVNSTPNRKYLRYTYREQLVDLIPSILLAAAMGQSGAASYIILSLAFRVSQFRYIIDILKNFIKVIRNRR